MATENIIYHYTSLDALINILKPGENEKIFFWASHAWFLNDPLEYKFALSLLKPSLEKYERENSKQEEFSKRLPDSFGIRLLNLAPGEPFLFSLSELSDDLSMWRAYGFDGSGVSIGLDRIGVCWKSLVVRQTVIFLNVLMMKKKILKSCSIFGIAFMMLCLILSIKEELMVNML